MRDFGLAPWAKVNLHCAETRDVFPCFFPSSSSNTLGGLQTLFVVTMVFVQPLDWQARRVFGECGTLITRGQDKDQRKVGTGNQPVI